MLRYRINRIYRTIQGEGYWTGMPCTLIRLQGCNLRCPFCDTKETWSDAAGRELLMGELLKEVASTHVQGQILLLTGGEPAMQPITPLARALRSQGPVHLETNGSLPLDPESYFSWVTVSPKKQGMPLDPDALGMADEIKWLVGGPDDVEGLKYFLEKLHELDYVDKHFKRISVQPISQDEEATKIAVSACLENGWRLSLQTHKYLEVP